jgi:hypothetical protein
LIGLAGDGLPGRAPRGVRALSDLGKSRWSMGWLTSYRREVPGSWDSDGDAYELTEVS